MLENQPTKITADRDNNVNLIRFVAACMVVFGHMATLLGSETAMPLGAIAVDIFFLLSGYLITASWRHSPRLVPYLVRRAARIFPGLVAVLLLTVFVLGPLVTSLGAAGYFASAGTWKYLFLVVLAPIENVLPGVFEGLPYPGAVNGSLWTLRYELLMYLLVPPACRLLDRLGKRGRVVTAAAVTALVLLHCLTDGSPDCPKAVRDVFRLSSYFAIGSCVRLFDLNGRLDAQHAVLALVALLLFAGGTGGVWTLGTVACLTVFTFGFCFCGSPRFSSLFRRNDISYGLYIYAFPVQQLVVQLGGVAPGTRHHLLACLPPRRHPACVRQLVPGGEACDEGRQGCLQTS